VDQGTSLTSIHDSDLKGRHHLEICKKRCFLPAKRPVCRSRGKRGREWRQNPKAPKSA
jgi:hypothetical protein